MTKEELENFWLPFDGEIPLVVEFPFGYRTAITRARYDFSGNHEAEIVLELEDFQANKSKKT